MRQHEIIVAMGNLIGVTDPTVAAKGGELLSMTGARSACQSPEVGVDICQVPHWTGMPSESR